MALQPIIWTGLIILFVFIEAMTVQLLSIWFVIGSVAALLASFFTSSIPIQVITFVAVSLLSFFLMRPLAQRRFFTQHEATNADRIVGTEGLVVEEVSRESGMVKVGGAAWTARANERIAEGEYVRILRIEGVKVIVERVPQ